MLTNKSTKRFSPPLETPPLQKALTYKQKQIAITITTTENN